MRAIVDEADDAEKEGGHDAVSEHLEDGAIEGIGTRLTQNGQVESENDDAHVGYRRESDDEFEVGLPHGHEGAVDDADGGQHRE